MTTTDTGPQTEARIQKAAIAACEDHYSMRHVNTIPPCAEARGESEWWAEVFELAIEAEARRLTVERLPDAILTVIEQMADGTNGLLDHPPREVADAIIAALAQEETRA